MRNFFLILKIRFQETFDLSSRLMLFILYAAMFAGVYFAADYLKTLGLAQVLPVVGYFGAVVLTFITTVIKINETFSGSEDSEFVFQISPEVGCHLTDQWAVGGEIGYTHYDDYNRFQFAPYARYTFYKTGIVGLFVDGTIGIAAGDGDTGFRLGLRPGLSLKATEHISFVTKVGFLGYSDSYNGTSDFGGVNFDTENISIGFHYNF